jgi:tRNA nucleotidyltransferase (CCA-adding enzyme)
MDWNPESITQDKLHAYRAAAEAAWGDDTRHENYIGHPQPSAGQCYVTSRWLTTKLGGHVGSKDGHYVWVSPDKSHVVDLTGDQFAYAPHHPAAEGLQLDGEDQPWEFPPDHKMHRPGPVMFKRITHPLYKGTRVKSFKGTPPRLQTFIQRADQALNDPESADRARHASSPRTSDFGWAGDSHPGQEPQVVERIEHDRPTEGPQHYKWVYANGRLELDPESDYNQLSDFAGAGQDHAGPIALGTVNVDNDGKALWEVTGNVGLGTLARVLQEHTNQVGWGWGGIKSVQQDRLASTMYWMLEEDGHLLLAHDRTLHFDGAIEIVGKTAKVSGPIGDAEEALQEWADDFGYHLALNTGLKTPEDIDGYDTYGPRPDYAQGPTDLTPPTGTLRCPECGLLFPSFGQYILHRKEEEPQGESLDDGHFPEMDMDKALKPHFHEREPFTFPLAKTAAKLDRHMDRLWDDTLTHYGAYLNGDLVGMASINRVGNIEAITAIRAPERVVASLVNTLKNRYDQLTYAGEDNLAIHRLQRMGFAMQSTGPFIKWAKGKEPMDLIPDSIPFIFDVDKDAIQVGQPGQQHNSIMGDFTPGGIVQGFYEPGGQITITNQTDIPWTVRHLVDLWYWSHPHMRVTDVQYEDPMGNKQKLTKTAAEIGQHVKQIAAMDPAVWKAYQALEAAGGEVFAVGGVARDALMGVDSNDVDLMCRGLHQDQVDQILRKLPGKVDITGKNFGVFRYNYKGHEVEIALPRTEKSTGDRRIDFDVNVDHRLPVEDDLLRRDFTGNSIAVSLKDGHVVDPFGGADDIKNGVLRTTHPSSFREDPTRILRALVMNGRYGWTPDERTRQEMAQHAGALHNESWDNMNKIMDKLMKSDNPARAIRLAQETGVLKHFMPELSNIWDYDQRNPHHNFSLGDHHMHVLEGVSQASGDPDLRMAALMHDWGKPSSRAMKCIDCDHVWHESDNPADPFTCPACDSHNTKGTFHGGDGVGHDHALVGQSMAEERLTHMKWPVARRKRIGELIRHHMFGAFSSQKGARKFLNTVGDHADDLLILRHADMFGKGTDEAQNSKTPVTHMSELVNQARQAPAPTALSGLAVNGRDLIQAGIPQGPMVGQVLNGLMQAVLENPELNERNQLMQMAQSYV